MEALWSQFENVMLKEEGEGGKDGENDEDGTEEEEDTVIKDKRR